MSGAQTSVQPANDVLLRNGLLRTLSERDRALLRPYMSPVQLQRGEALIQPDQNIEWAHFPCNGTVISLIVVMPGAQTAQASRVGSEGAVGGVVSRGQSPSFVRAVTQIPGEACRIRIEALEEAKAKSPTLVDGLARYADCLLAQLLQAVACNTLHTLEQRMAALLAWVHDRQDGADLPLTQVDLGEMLGVARTYVTKTAAAFQDRGLIGYARGRVRVLNRVALAEAACPCHSMVHDHFERILPGVDPILVHRRF